MRNRIAAALVGFGLVACSQSGTEPGVAAAAEQQLPADQVMYGLEHTVTDQGVRQALLRADSGFVHQGRSNIDLIGVKLTFYNEAGVQTGNLTSRTGEYDMGAAGTGRMIAKGRVVMRASGRVIESEELHYDPQAGQIWSSLATVIRQGGKVLRGTSFRSDTRFQNVNIAGLRTEGGAAGGSGGVGSITF